MLSIRLRRIGKKSYPTYRIIVLEKKKDPFGDYLEDLGFYSPVESKSKIQLKKDRIEYWLSKGAQPSPTIHNLLVNENILKAPKAKVVKIRKKRKEEMAKKEREAEKAKIETEKKEEKPNAKDVAPAKEASQKQETEAEKKDEKKTEK